ncbi:threonine-phosphate decarboxylase CobD [Pseudaestuariivita sp.]|uniref:threonine-phosphate decarboxylase CobD n=1 Tax=Pseudaestuariivita sp. TaxID=2211669 RepID=UPI004058293A
MRDHGGNLDAAVARFGGAVEDWIDLSTGINRVPYPVTGIDSTHWQALPTDLAVQGLVDAALAAYRTDAPILPLAGASHPIQLLPRVLPKADMRVLGPTYNEHAASARAAGWDVSEVTSVEALHGAAVAVVVNPNNPDGRHLTPDAVAALSREVGLLVVDESFADATPEMSVCPRLDALDQVLVLRSFGKFYGLAGLRLGFALGPAQLLMTLREAAGPWSVNGPALEVGRRALSDEAWAAETRARLADEAEALDEMALTAGWHCAGGTGLFRLYETEDAEAAQTHLAEHKIWSRVFPYSKTWLRLGLPGLAGEWDRLKSALRLLG